MKVDPTKVIGDLWAQAQAPEVVQQVAAIALSVAAAYFASRWCRNKSGQSGRWSRALTQLSFPLLAVLFTAVAQELLEQTGHVKLIWAAVALFGSLALIRITLYFLKEAFPSATWMATSERWITGIVWVGLVLHLAGWMPIVVNSLDRVALHVGNVRVSLWVACKATVIVLATIVVALWIGGLIESRLFRVTGFDASLRIASVRLAKALVMLIALMVALSLVGIDITALSVFTGALGVGIGLGLQKIASNYLCGFIILLERSIRIGNVVQVGNDINGTVTEITTRYTVLKNLVGVEFIVPNETMIGSTVQNQSYTDSRVRGAFSIGIDYDTPDIDAVLRLMESIAQQHPRVIEQPPPKAALQSFTESAIVLEVGFWIEDPQAGIAGVRSDVALSIWKAFKAHGVKVPQPQKATFLMAAPPA